MNFFEHQDKARSSTQLLVVLFSCAIAALIALTTLLVVFALGFTRPEGAPPEPLLEQMQRAPEVFAAVSVVVISIVLLGVLFRVMQLRGGGKAVAEGLGGRLLNVQTRDEQERRVLNVVEEMAIAAGMPVPQVFLIEDPAINAFAAGYRGEDAVIGVTRGCITELNRDELQGVIAHEFSHILNGDMRLNIKLIAWLYGITVIGLIGYHLLRSMRYAGRSSRKKGGGGLFLLGFGLIVVGYGGTFFGKLIRAAVSRQREFLADASAVQFTRNLGGIGGALKRIAEHGAGSQITAINTREISHMLFGPGAGFAGLFATHPPIEERIRRIDPHWDGTFTKRAHIADAETEPKREAQAQAQQVFANVGLLTAAALAEAQRRLHTVSPGLRAAAHNTLGACMTVLAVLVSSASAEARRIQLQYLHAHMRDQDLAELAYVLGEVADLDRKLYLPLIDLALPALHELSASQCETFFAQLDHLVNADAEVSLFEWCLLRVVRSSLRREKPTHAQHDLQHSLDAVRTLLAAVARAGNGEDQRAVVAFAAGLHELEGKEGATFSAAPSAELPAATGLDALDTALEQLRNLKPLQKPRLLKALARCARVDGEVTAAEQELLRAIGAVLDCPVPPLA